METEKRLLMGSALIRSIVLSVTGLLCIALGLSFLPGIGIIAGAALLAMAVYPWLKFAHLKKVNILIGSVTDNYLNSQVLPVAILSSSKERDGFDFDPGILDPASALFGPSRARPVENMSDPLIYQRNMIDVNNDGIPDLVLYFSGDDAGITSKIKEACVRAKTLDGRKIYGCGKIEYGVESRLGEALAYR